MICQNKNCKKEFTPRTIRGKYCSRKCKNTVHSKIARRKLKLKAIEYKGGKCSICGYSKSIAALEFHHVSKELKEFAISVEGNSRSWSKIKKELEKCILLCSNCHRELHEAENYV